MNLSDLHYYLDRWCPTILVALLFIILFPIRVVVLMCLPPDSTSTWHPLHKIQQFFSF